MSEEKNNFLRKTVYAVLFFCVVIAIFWAQTAAEAYDYYVRPATGDCTYNGDGSTSSCAVGVGEAGAWKGFSNIVWGASGVDAGDTLYLYGGKTYLSEQLSIGASGSSGSPIEISVYGAGTAVIDGQESVKYIIRGNGNDYITIDGVRGAAIDGNYTYGLKMQNPSMPGNCIYDYSNPHDWLITRVECYGEATTGNDYSGGIYMGGNIYNIEISYSWVHGPVKSYENRDQQWHATGIKIWNGSASHDTSFDKIKIHHNKVEYLYNDGIASSWNASLYNNYVKYIHGSGHSDSLLIQSGSYAKVYNNYVESNDQNIYIDNLASSTISNIYIYNNVTKGTNGFGVVPHAENGGIDELHIYNNTFVFEAGGGIRQGSGSIDLSNVHIKNNYFGKCGNGYFQINIRGTNSVIELDYNLYATGSPNYPDLVNLGGTYYTLSELRTIKNFELNGSEGDPTFRDSGNDDYYPDSSDTMLIDRGVNLSMYFITDKFSILRPEALAWDIGAYEFTDESIIAPSPPLNLRIVLSE